jgi:cytochrome P450
MNDHQPVRRSWFNLTKRQAPLLPGPRGLPVLGSLLEVWGDPVQYLLQSRSRYGDLFQFKVGPRPFIFASHPDAIQHLLQDHHRNYVHWPRDNGNYRALLGHGLLANEGEIWRRHRSLVQPAFHRRRLELLVGTVVNAVAEVSARWDRHARSGQPVDVGAEMGWLTLAIVTRALYGLDASDQAELIGGSLSKAIRHIAHGVMLPFELPEFANRRFLETVRALDAVVYDIIQSRQGDSQERNDMLAMLMDARDESGAGLSLPELRDEVMNFLIAGHETSALGLTWTWYLLAQHPEVEHRLHAETAQILGGRAPNFADLANLPYLDMVIHEALRLYPPAGTMVRYALNDDEIGGCPIPAGSVIIFSQYITQRLSAFWPDPEVFDPERFSSERPAQRPRYAYFPFGGGPRQCIGIHFAQMELPVVLAILTQRYRLELLPGHAVDPRPAMDMYPRRPIMMRVVVRPGT